MKLVLSLLDSPAFGGAEQYLLDHLYFLQREIDSTVILATNNPDVKERIRDDGNKITVINLPYRLDAIGNWKGLIKFFVHAPFALIWFLSKLFIFSQTYNRIIIYTPGFSDRMLFSPFIKLMGHKLIWLEYGPLQTIFKRNWGFPKLLFKFAQSSPNKVVVISKYTRQSLLDHTAIPKEKIVRIYPGAKPTTLDEVFSLRKQGLIWRKKQGLGNKKIITFVGRLASEKEVDLLIKAFKQVSKKHKTIHLVLVGDGPERKQYEKLVSKFNLLKSVFFTGFVSEEEKKIIIATSDVFVFPSSWELEGFGMTTMEAMMIETPVITSGFGPQSEIVTDGETGMFFSPHTPRGLTDTIGQLLTKPQKAKKLAIAGRERALALFSLPRNLKKLMPLFAS
jgi:glycosyltransferase involved in cell wall biosynthesis